MEKGGSHMKTLVSAPKTLLIGLALFALSGPGLAKTAQTVKANLTTPSGEPEAIQVKGQTRNVSLMNVSQNEKDSVKFVSARKNYKGEILSTQY
jgi:hypothetical protein